MELTAKKERGRMTFFFNGEIDEFRCRTLRGELDREIAAEAPDEVVFDMGGVSFVAPAGGQGFPRERRLFGCGEGEMKGNYMKIEIPALGRNESFARNVVAGFAVECAPTVGEISDIKTAVSEAVTNAVVHAYDEENDSNLIEIAADIDDDNTLTVSVRDFGRGIEDVAEAREPFFTTKPDAERSGMGFTIIETFMDDLEVESAPGKGTTVIMRKRIGGNVGA